MTKSEWYAFLDAIHFNDWGFVVLLLIVWAGVAYWKISQAKKPSDEQGEEQDEEQVPMPKQWPGDAYWNRTTVGKRAAAYRKTRPYK